MYENYPLIGEKPQKQNEEKKFDVFYGDRLMRASLTEEQIDLLYKELSWTQKLNIKVYPTRKFKDLDKEMEL